MIWKLEGYLLIPHELLHVAAHRLSGKRCSYRLGEPYVTHLEPHSWGERLFCLLFPLIVSLPIALLPLFVWIVTYIDARYPVQHYLALAPLWHQTLFVLWFLLFNYVASSCFFDVIKAIRLLVETPW